MLNIFRTGRPTNFKLGIQTEHEDPHQQQASWPPSSKVKVAFARSRDASDRCWPISREWNVLETPKLVWRFSTSRSTMHRSFKVKGQRSRSPGRLMLRLEMRNIFRTGKPMNFSLGSEMEHDDPHQQQVPWSPRSKVKVARSRDASDRCWPISREWNILATPKLVRRLSISHEIMCTSFKVKGLRSRSLGRLMLTQLMRNIFQTGIPTKFKLGTRTEQEDPHQ